MYFQAITPVFWRSLMFYGVPCLLFLPKNVESGMSGAFVEEKTCAMLYSTRNFSGDAFILKDFDQSVNMKKDYRVSLEGWKHTGSIRVDNSCSMSICNGTYFQGVCRILTSGDYQSNQIFSPILSADCNCAKNCNCRNVFVPRSSRTCGRAYLTGACTTCNSEYTPLQCGYAFFPDKLKDFVEIIVLRKGCSMTSYSDVYFGGTHKLLTTEVSVKSVENQFKYHSFQTDFNGTVASYKIDCGDQAFDPPVQSISYPRLINLPVTVEDIIDDLIGNVKHPGIHASLKSLANGRSSKNAYIIMIGESDPSFMGLDGCERYSDKIGECHLSVNLDRLGIATAQIRVIYAAIGSRKYDTVNDDARWIASLEKYLSTHSELHDLIPNAVVTCHDAQNDVNITDKGSTFQRKLQALNLLYGRLTDEDYPNLIYLVRPEGNASVTEQRNPEKSLTRYDQVVNNSFPTVIVSAKLVDLNANTPKINGYWKMPNEEYWPQNLQKQLIRICEKSGDPLGRAIFQAAFSEETQKTFIGQYETDLLDKNNSKVNDYREWLKSGDTQAFQNNSVFLAKKQNLSRALLFLSLNFEDED